MGWQTFLIRKYAESRPQSFKKDSLHKRRKKAERGQKKLEPWPEAQRKNACGSLQRTLRTSAKSPTSVRGRGREQRWLCCAVRLCFGVLFFLFFSSLGQTLVVVVVSGTAAYWKSRDRMNFVYLVAFAILTVVIVVGAITAVKGVKCSLGQRERERESVCVCVCECACVCV